MISISSSSSSIPIINNNNNNLLNVTSLVTSLPPSIRHYTLNITFVITPFTSSSSRHCHSLRYWCCHYHFSRRCHYFRQHYFHYAITIDAAISFISLLFHCYASFDYWHFFQTLLTLRLSFSIAITPATLLAICRRCFHVIDYYAFATSFRRYDDAIDATLLMPLFSLFSPLLMPLLLLSITCLRAAIIIDITICFIDYYAVFAIISICRLRFSLPLPILFDYAAIIAIYDADWLFFLRRCLPYDTLIADAIIFHDIIFHYATLFTPRWFFIRHCFVYFHLSHFSLPPSLSFSLFITDWCFHVISSSFTLFTFAMSFSFLMLRHFHYVAFAIFFYRLVIAFTLLSSSLSFLYHWLISPLRHIYLSTLRHYYVYRITAI